MSFSLQKDKHMIVCSKSMKLVYSTKSQMKGRVREVKVTLTQGEAGGAGGEAQGL